MSNKLPIDELPAEPRTVTLDELLEGGEPADAPAVCVADCIDARHPSIAGRVRVRWAHAGRVHERWVPALTGLAIREGDRVLLTRAENHPEPVVTGVLDGFADRPPVPTHVRSTLELKPDEHVRISRVDGTPLLDVVQGQDGPVVKLLAGDVGIELPGKLRLDAEEIELRARRGQVRIKASDDVIVRGEIIRLN